MMKLRTLVAGALALGLTVPARCEFRALVIGIDSYGERDPSFSNLHGVWDAMRFEAMLMTNWRQSNPKIKRLWDRDASKAKIVDAVENWLVKGAKPDDTLVLFFSGHGTTVPADLSTRIRSALVPQDVRRSKRGKGLSEESLLTGKYFRDEMLAMRAKGIKNFTMIVDACESGGLRRNGVIAKAIRNEAPGVATGIPEGGGPLFDEQQALGDYVVISAAGATEWAWQGPKGGYLTIALTDAVRNFHQGNTTRSRQMTYLDAQDWILNEMDNMSQHGAPQHPFLAGRLDRPLFAGGAIPNDPYYGVTVEKVNQKRPVIRIRAGALFGVNKSTTFAIYPAGTLHFANVKPMGRAKVTQVGTYDCVVVPIGMSESADRLAASRARIIGDSSSRKLQAVMMLGNTNARVKLQVEAISLASLSGHGQAANQVLSSAAPDQFITFRVCASGPNGKPLIASDNFRFVQLLACSTAGEVTPIWPESGRSAEETRLIADGKWRYLSKDGALIDTCRVNDLAFWQMDTGRLGVAPIFKLIGTSMPIDYAPLMAESRLENVSSISSKNAPKWYAQPTFNRNGSRKSIVEKTPVDYSVATLVLRLKSGQNK